MELKSLILVEVKKDDRVYRFEMPVGAPLGECYDAAFQALNKIAELMRDAASKAERKDEPAEEVKADVLN